MNASPVFPQGDEATSSSSSAEIVKRREQAELVPAQAVRAAVRPYRSRHLLAQPREQHVSGGVAEAVVVGLEAVEVEQGEQPALGSANHPIEVVEQHAAVAEPRERVRHRLRLRTAQQAHVRPKVRAIRRMTTASVAAASQIASYETRAKWS